MSKTKFFDAFLTHHAGIWCFTPQKEKAYQQGKPVFGFGMISYLEGSVYSGEIYFDGKEYHKQGFGQQWFTFSDIGKYSSYHGAKAYLFEGNFDYRKTNWTYGNGVLYYLDKQNRPKYFVKGFFLGLSKVGEYEGEFQPSKLHQGFTMDMEIPLPLFMGFDVGLEEMKAQAEIQILENLFIGDSYMEFWHYPFWAGKNRFEEVFDTKTSLNLGIGGSTCFDYPIFYHQKFSLLEQKPRRIFVNLGFNDCNSLLLYSVKELLAEMEHFVKEIHLDYPTSEIYWFTVCKTPGSKENWNRIDAYNAFLRTHQARLDYQVIDVADAFFDHHCLDEDYGSYFHEDGIHPTEKGYQMFVEETKKVLKK